MATKLDSLLPKTTGYKPLDLGEKKPVAVESTATVQQSETPARTNFTEPMKHGTLAKTGERADAPQVQTGGLGWQEELPMVFMSGKDVKSPLNGVQRVLDEVQQAIAHLKGGADGRATLAAAVDRSEQLRTLLTTYASKFPLLPATDLAPVKQLIATLDSGIKAAEAAERQLVKATSTFLLMRGAVEMKQSALRNATDAEGIAWALADVTTTQPTFVEFYGNIVSMEPGDASTQNARVKQAIAHYEAQRTQPSEGLRFARQELSRRVVVTEAQFGMPRTNSEIATEATIRAVEEGYDRKTVYAEVGYAISDLMNHVEIEQFASHLIGYTLSLVARPSGTDKTQAVDLALQNAQGVVRQFGPPDRDLQALWSTSLQQAAEALKT